MLFVLAKIIEFHQCVSLLQYFAWKSVRASKLWVRRNSWFYDFCGFWSVAVNTVDKLQFLIFIFAVLLPNLSTSSFDSYKNIDWITSRIFAHHHAKFDRHRQSEVEIWYLTVSQCRLSASLGWWKLNAQLDHPLSALGDLCRYAEFGWNWLSVVRHLGFWKVRILKLGRARRTHTRHLTKFRQNRTKRCGDIAI